MDPNLKEEATMSGHITCVMNKQNEICSLQKGGRIGVRVTVVLPRYWPSLIFPGIKAQGSHPWMFRGCLGPGYSFLSSCPSSHAPPNIYFSFPLLPTYSSSAHPHRHAPLLGFSLSCDSRSVTPIMRLRSCVDGLR